MFKVFLLVLISIQVLSLNHICAEQLNLISGIENIQISNIQNGDVINFLTSNRRSHCCTIKNLTNPQSVRFTEATTFSNVNLIHVNRGNDYPFVAFTGNDSGANRKCFYYENDSEDTLIARIFLPIEKVGNSTSPTFVQCEDTTLIGGFNTSVSEFNFLEIKNNASQSFFSNGVINGKIIMFDAISNTRILEREFQISPQSRQDIDLHSISGPGRFGTITIYHDGPPDSISAITMQYKIKNQNPLQFEPVAQQKFQTQGKRR